MRSVKMLMLSAASSLLITAVSYAQAPACSDEPNVSQGLYEGVDAQGRIVRLTISDASIETFERVSPPARRYPELHWTSQIGTGKAAARLSGLHAREGGAPRSKTSH